MFFIDNSVVIYSVMILILSFFLHQLLKLVDIIYPSREGDEYKNKNRKIDMVMRLVKLYEPYVLFKGMYVEYYFSSVKF